MKITPLYLQKTVPFQSTNHKKDASEPSLADMEIVNSILNKAQTAKEEADKIKEQSLFEEKKARAAKLKAQNEYQKVLAILDDVTGMRNAPEGTVFTPKKNADGSSEIYEGDMLGNVYKITTLYPDGKIYVKQASNTQGKLDHYYIDTKGGIIKIMLGVMPLKDGNMSDESIIYSDGQLLAYSKKHFENKHTSTKGEQFVFKNGEIFDVEYGITKADGFASVKKTYTYKNSKLQEYIEGYVSTKENTFQKREIFYTNDEKNTFIYINLDERMKFSNDELKEYICFSDRYHTSAYCKAAFENGKCTYYKG